MKAFMDKEFMLQSATAQHLYHDYARLEHEFLIHKCFHGSNSFFDSFIG